MAAPLQTALLLQRDGSLVTATDVALPTRKSGELLVKIVSTSVNPVDSKLGGPRLEVKHYPKIPGGDIAGVVVEADADSKFKPGDKIFAHTQGFLLPTPDSGGSYAQYATVPQDAAAKVPSNLPLEQAGGVPLVALTAWQALAGAAPQAGQRALILGASGGVGHFAVQFAKVLGLHTVAVAGPTNQEFLKELGADEVVNYKTQNVDELYKDTGFDIVFDLIGGAAAHTAYKLLSPSGYFAHIYNTGSDQEFLGKIAAAAASGEGPKTGSTLTIANGEQLSKIAELFEEGKVKLVVDSTIPLDAAAVKAAQARLLSGSGVRGKVVIRVQDA